MPLWTPDPTFYPSPKIAMEAPPEKLAFVAMLNTGNGNQKDAPGVVDTDRGSSTYGKIVGKVDMPNGDSPTGSNNVWWGVGAGPSQTTANISADPLFNSTVNKDFYLQSSSLAKDTGVTISRLLFSELFPSPVH